MTLFRDVVKNMRLCGDVQIYHNKHTCGNKSCRFVEMML